MSFSYKNIWFVLLLLFLWITTTFAALSTEEKWKILSNFTENQYEMLFESNIWELEAEDLKIFNVSKRANIFWNIWEKLEWERKKYESQSEMSMNRIMSLEDSISGLDLDIEEATLAVTKVNAKIITIKREVSQNKKNIEELREKIKNNRELLLKYLVYVYKKTNNVSEWESIDNIKSILMDGGDMSDIINDLHFKWILQVAGQKMIEEHRKLVSDMYKKKLQLERQEDDLKRIRKIEILDRKILSDKKKFRERLLEVSRGKQKLYEKFVKDKIQAEKKIKLKAFQQKIKFDNIKGNLLQKYGCRFVDMWENTLESRTLTGKCLELNKILYAESQLKGFGTNASNIFMWPISPKLWITSYYKADSYREMFGADHEAIDVAIPQGTAIKAPADWYVTLLQAPDSIGYSFVALKHSDWMVTVFGHLSEVLVDKFDFVKKGQTFAKTGWEYGTMWAWLMTTWPHLHMEVFQDKVNVDPLNFLDLSYLKYGNLPGKYKYKFLADFRAKKWYDYQHLEKTGKVFRLDGYTEVERQRSLLQKYAVGPFKNWDLWVEESLDANLDPSFVMCIGLAETGLWKNLKTPYNVWNVGNTDSWATKHFQNANQWVFAMASTLNNRYLWGYNTINMLSRYGNKNPKKPIYASSEFNWHNNIMKCLSWIKGRHVPDNYYFRLVK